MYNILCKEVNMEIDIGNILIGIGTILIGIGTIMNRPSPVKKKKKHK